MITLITGPSGSGKSSTAEELASHWKSKCALIKFDKLRTFIKSGYAEPALGWNEETKRQWDVAKQVVAEMSKVYNRNNIQVFIDAFITPGEDYESWKILFKDLQLKTIVLLPSQKTVLDRNNQRDGIERLKEEDINQNYEWSKAWGNIPGVKVIDNSIITIEETINVINKYLS